MIKLIVGLGNPGEKYIQTRHNAGFLFLDRFLTAEAGHWGLDPRFEGLVGDKIVDGRSITLLKPNTFMNKSGQSVGKMARYFKLQPEQILVVHDELDFDVGVAKVKKGGGHAGHNGLRDIISHLGSADFYRLRIGVGRPLPSVNVADYVLSIPAPKEREVLESVYDYCKLFVNQMINGDVDKAINGLNAYRKQ